MSSDKFSWWSSCYEFENMQIDRFSSLLQSLPCFHQEISSNWMCGLNFCISNLNMVLLNFTVHSRCCKYSKFSFFPHFNLICTQSLPSDVVKLHDQWCQRLQKNSWCCEWFGDIDTTAFSCKHTLLLYKYLQLLFNSTSARFCLFVCLFSFTMYFI